MKLATFLKEKKLKMILELNAKQYVRKFILFFILT
jgi:hypothetical protein